MPESRKGALVSWRVRVFLALMLPALVYTFARYAIFKGVPLDQWPLYLMNKVISLTAVALLAASYLVRSVAVLRSKAGGRTIEVVRCCGLLGFALVGVHLSMSLVLLTPAYFPDLFAEGKLSFSGELSLLSGVLGFWCLMLPVFATILKTRAMRASRWRYYQRMGYLALALVVVHLVAMGWSKWLMPSAWPGHLPPITLIGTLLVLIPLVMRGFRMILSRRGRA